MPNRTFLWFIGPSALVVLIFIALPIVSVLVQSLYVEHQKVMVEQEVCSPFRCVKEMRIDEPALRALQRDEPLGRFNGLGTYVNRAHLAVDELRQLWASSRDWRDFIGAAYQLPFYGALAFTLAYTAIVTPLTLLLGFLIALAMDRLPKVMKGPAVFLSILPMIITPLIGSLILFWMIDARGIFGSVLQQLMHDTTLSLKASASLTWITLFVYGVWSSAPFAFVVFYAALQTVPQDTMESAMVDGANRWERLRYVTLPHLAPVLTFVTLIEVMDHFRVFEPIVGFNAEASAQSLSWLIYNDLRGADGQLFGSAASTSVLTILGVGALLTPVLLKARREFARAR